MNVSRLIYFILDKKLIGRLSRLVMIYIERLLKSKPLPDVRKAFQETLIKFNFKKNILKHKPDKAAGQDIRSSRNLKL